MKLTKQHFGTFVQDQDDKVWEVIAVSKGAFDTLYSLTTKTSTAVVYENGNNMQGDRQYIFKPYFKGYKVVDHFKRDHLGEKVYHPIFGKGKITAVESDGPRLNEVTVKYCDATMYYDKYGDHPMGPISMVEDYPEPVILEKLITHPPKGSICECTDNMNNTEVFYSNGLGDYSRNKYFTDYTLGHNYFKSIKIIKNAE